MTDLYGWLVAFSLLVLLFGLFAKWFHRRWYFTQPLTAVVLGVLVGPVGLGVLTLPAGIGESRFLQEVARITLAVADLGVALRLPSGYPVKHWRSLAIVLGAGMILMMLASGLLVWGLLGVPLWVALLVAATVTSTDPIVATTIVTGTIAEKHVPARVRHFISAESGANDGAVYPLVLLPVLIITRPVGEALSTWLLQVVVWQVVGAVVLGIAFGYGASQLLGWTERAGIVEEGRFLAYTFALSLVVLGVARLLGVDGVLAAFVTGIAYRMSPGTEHPTEEQRIQRAMTKFFTLPSFVVIGIALPWAAWGGLGWRGLALAGLVLLLRRPPIILALAGRLEPLRTRKDVLFTAWFGPIGVSALFYAMLAQRRTGLERVWPVASLLLCASLIAHGFSATPFSRRMSGDGGTETTDGE